MRPRPRQFLGFAAALGLAALLPGQPAATPASPAPTPTPATTEAEEMTMDDLFETGKTLFEAYAPESVKQRYAFPTKAQWDAFAVRLQSALQNQSLDELADYEDQARAALAALELMPEYADYADWLKERLDYIEAARSRPSGPSPTPTPSPVPSPTPGKPRPTRVPGPTPTGSPTSQIEAEIPYYELWLGRLRHRAPPAGAAELAPALKPIFVAEGVPAGLIWLAEAESTFNPEARSPVGARGLFQLMPVTAKAQGLSLLPFDERTHPEKSARAAATLLRRLHGRFASWPLALAAYNAGEGTVSRALKARNGRTFADIASSLPAETRMYVPKVLATLAVREGLSPLRLPAPASIAKP